MTEEKKKPVKMSDVQAKADERACPVQRSLVFIEEFLAQPMCGRCFPCSMGVYEARTRINRMIDGTATEEDVAKVKEISSYMLTSSMCKKGKDTGQYLLDQMETGEPAEHVAGSCKSGECNTAYLSYFIVQDNCTMCGDCLDACKDNAIAGEKVQPYLSGYMPYEIAQKRCTKCGECLKVCKYNAVITKTAKEQAEEPATV